jgi:hypothetical protein
MAMSPASANAQQLPHSLRATRCFGQRVAAEARKAPAPPVARYVSETGDAFILDRAAPQPLMKFDNSSEVWVLSSQPARAATPSTRTSWASPCCGPASWAA